MVLNSGRLCYHTLPKLDAFRFLRGQDQVLARIKTYDREISSQLSILAQRSAVLFLLAGALLVGLQSTGAAKPKDSLLFVAPTGAKPYVYKDNGQNTGILADIIAKLGAQTGLKIDIQMIDFSKAHQSVKDGKADAVMPPAMTPERAGLFDFTTPIFNIVFTLFTRGKEKYPAEWPNLSGVRVGVFSKSTSQSLTKKWFPKATPVMVTGTENAMRAVQHSEVDAMTITRHTGYDAIFSHNIGNVVALPIMLSSVPASSAVRKGNTEPVNELNTVLVRIKAEGKLDDILNSWENSRVALFSKGQIWTVTSLVAGAVALIILTLVFFYIRRLRLANSNLQDEIAGHLRTTRDLKESHARFQAIFDNSSTLISLKDRNGVILMTNRQFEILDGPAPADYVGKTDFDLFPRATAEDLWANDLAAMEADAPIRAEETVRHKDGEWHTYLTVKFPVRVGDEAPFGTCAISTDITAQKQATQALQDSEERFRLVVERTPVPLMIIDRNGSIVLLNKKFVELYGYTLEDIPTRDDWWKTAYPDPEYRTTVHQSWMASLESAPLNNDNIAPQQWHLVRKDGETREVEFQHFTISEDRYAVTMNDVTERMKDEQNLRKAKEEAEYANHTKSQFLANMSHELRTPLNAIIGFSDMMIEGAYGSIGGEKNQEYVNDINTSGRDLLGIISDILDFSKIEVGAIEFNDTPVDIKEISKSCIRVVWRKAEAKRQNLKFQSKERLPLISTDEFRLKQILANLIFNSVKFSPPDSTILVEAHIDEDGGCVIKVIDSGIGMKPDDIPRALEPFGQIVDIRAKSHEGSGLGLHMSKSLMEAQGGTLHVDSELEQGTTVTIRFPPEKTLG